MEKLTLFGTFLEGLLSFLSPCVLPLLPVYMAYLSGDAKIIDENGNVKYKTGKVFITTFFFVLGICTTFFLLGLGVNFLSQFLNKYNDIIAIIGGTLLIIFGIHETGLITISFLNEEKRLKVKLNFEKMNFFKAYLFGLVFSFAWSPCIGPMLTNALLLAATEPSGFLYIVMYTLGLVIPFLLTGLFTGTILNFFNKKKGIMKVVLIISGIILILSGIYMIYNASKNIIASQEQVAENVSYMDKEYHDQNGNTIVLSDYEGQYVMLNFITTWCPYCKEYMPEYLEFAKNSDMKCFYVMSPLNSGEEDVEGILKFIDEYGIDIPVIIDEDGTLTSAFGISSFPTGFVLGPDGTIIGYATTSIDADGLQAIYESAQDLYNEN